MTLAKPPNPCEAEESAERFKLDPKEILPPVEFAEIEPPLAPLRPRSDRFESNEMSPLADKLTDAPREPDPTPSPTASARIVPMLTLPVVDTVTVPAFEIPAMSPLVATFEYPDAKIFTIEISPL